MAEIRQERHQDFDEIRAIHERAFAPSREEADIVDALHASGDHVPDLCLVALHDGAPVGHIAFSRATVGTIPVLALAPIAVLPERQRQGIGSALVSAALEGAAQSAFPLVIVVGHPAYYPRFGFEPASPLGIDAPFEIPAEAWMAYRLPAYSPDVQGKVRYAPAFG